MASVIGPVKAKSLADINTAVLTEFENYERDELAGLARAGAEIAHPHLHRRARRGRGDDVGPHSASWRSRSSARRLDGPRRHHRAFARARSQRADVPPTDQYARRRRRPARSVLRASFDAGGRSGDLHRRRDGLVGARHEDHRHRRQPHEPRQDLHPPRDPGKRRRGSYTGRARSGGQQPSRQRRASEGRAVRRTGGRHDSPDRRDLGRPGALSAFRARTSC